MPTLGQVASPSLGSAGWKLLNVISGGYGDKGFSLGSLRPEDFGMSQEQMLTELRKYDPAAQFDTYNFSNEGGGSYTQDSLRFDVNKLPDEFKKVAVKPGAYMTNVAGVKLNDDGSANTSDLYNPAMVKSDPIFGYYTPYQNSKYRTQETPLGRAVGMAIPMLAGWAVGGGLPGMVWGLGNAAIRAGAGGNWQSLIPTAIGAGLGYAGGLAGINPSLTTAGRTLAQLAFARPRRG